MLKKMRWCNCSLRDRISSSLATLEETSLLNTGQNIYLVVLWVVLSITCLVLLNRFWAPSRRRVHNDVVGWQISIIGTIYAVMIGFMLYAVWANFQTAETNVDNEANSLANLYQTADGLPATQRDEVQNLARKYAFLVVTKEWPAMSHEQLASAGFETLQQLWEILSHTPAQSPLQEICLQQAMRELNSLSEHRRIRRLEARTKMPTILWAVLIIGGVITIGSSCLIGSENVVLHFALIMALSFLISLALVAIGDIDQPFQGMVHVNPTAFARAQATMEGSGTVPK